MAEFVRIYRSRHFGINSVEKRSRDGGLRFGDPFLQANNKMFAGLRTVGDTSKFRETPMDDVLEI